MNKGTMVFSCHEVDGCALRHMVLIVVWKGQLNNLLVNDLEFGG
jgi:hypothetical protein